jgi:hypothetical protein
MQKLSLSWPVRKWEAGLGEVTAAALRTSLLKLSIEIVQAETGTPIKLGKCDKPRKSEN